MIKKYLSFCLVALMIFSSLQFTALAETQALEFEIKPSDGCYIRNKFDTVDTPLGGSIFVVDNEKSPRMSFIKFDFADYAENIDDLSDIKLNLAASDVKVCPVNNYTLYIMPDSMEDWSSSSLTWNEATKRGMTTAGELLYTSDSLVKDEWHQSADLSGAIKQHLADNPGNTVVTFRLHSSLAVAYVIHGMGSGFEPKLTVKQEINPEKVVQSVYDNLTFESINPDDAENVTSMFDLPTTAQYDTTITWSSSDESVVNPFNGLVTPPKWGEGDKTVTLTALIENFGYSLTKEFEFVVAESTVFPDEMLLEEPCYAVDSTFVRGGAFEGNVVNNGNIVVDGIDGNNNRMGFVKFDFTGYEDFIANANSMQLKLDVSNDAKAENNNDFLVYVLPEECENIDTLALTYTEARKAGLISYTDNLIWHQTGVTAAKSYRSGDIWRAIRENLENGSNNVVWLKVAASSQVGYSIYGAGSSDATKPTLIIRYPKPACYLDLLSMKLPETVSGNIDLPKVGSFGSDITWESSDEAVISVNGDVAVDTADEDYSKEDKTVTLKATAVSGEDTFEKEFTVRVVRKGVCDAIWDATATEEAVDTEGAELSLGGTNIRIPVLAFDISGDPEYFKSSRKTVLKLYGLANHESRNVTVFGVSDEALLKLDETELTLTDAINMASLEAKYIQNASFEDDYAVVDVTEYLRSLKGEKAMFALVSEGAGYSIVSSDGTLNSNPKLIASPVGYTDEFAASDVADSLKFSNLSFESQDAVRKSLSLPKTGRFGAVIEWTSDNESVINPITGEVSRPSSNTKVTLTATVRVGDALSKKVFEINVIKEETDKEYAQYLATTLKPEYDILTSSITLKGAELSDEATVTWESSEPYEASVNGFNLTLNRPSSSDLPVQLTATVTYKGETAVKSYNVTVVRSANKNILRNRKITSGDSSASRAIDEDISTVWKIKNSSFVVDMGSAKVVSGLTIVPEEADFSGLTLSISDDMYKWEKAFSGGSFEAGKLNYITLDPIAYGRYIKFEFPDSAKAISFIAAYNAVDSDSGDVFASIEIPSEAKKDFKLPESLYGNPIEWTSSSMVITIDDYTAEVKASSNGKNVTLTAEVIINDEKHTKSYVVYVPGTGASSGGGGGGGKGSSGGSGFVASPLVPVAPVQPEVTGFTDLSAASWATDYINYLADKGIVNGKSKTEFAPNDNLKREEMAKIITLAFNLPESQNPSDFADVAENAWYAPYVASLKISGITSGMGDGTFGTGLDITRQDAFKMIASVLELDTSNSTATSFNDDAEISDYARGCINALVAMGIVGGDENGNVNPTARITRAEIAKVICLAISYK